MKQRTKKYGTKEYWKTADEYQFNTDDKGKLVVYAHSPKAAKLKATNWEKWLKKEKRGNDKVLKDTIKKIVYKKEKL